MQVGPVNPAQGLIGRGKSVKISDPMKMPSSLCRLSCPASHQPGLLVRVIANTCAVHEEDDTG